MMKSVVCLEPGKLAARESDIPEPKAGEVLVRIRAIGICGTDIHAYGGNQPYFEYPRVLGHELSGTIEATGDGVDLPINQSVYIIPYLHCGKCASCRRGKTNCCSNIQVIGVHRDGGMCEYLCVPESAVVITEGLSFDQMALVECLAIGAHAVRRAEIVPEDTVLVMGTGPIGIGALQFAQVKGAKVIVSDLSPEKRDFCKEQFHVAGTIDPAGDVKAQLADMTDGEFPSVIIDCTGNVRAMESAFECLGHGGTIVFVSVVKSDIRFPDPEFHKRETTLKGSRNATKSDFEHVVSCLQNGSVKSHAMITHKAKFSELTDIFPEWVKPGSGVIKAVVEMD